MTLSLRPHSIALATAVGAVIPLFSAGPSVAAPPMFGSGTGMVTGDQVTSARIAGPNRIVERQITGVLTGSLDGTFTETVVGVVHPDGTVTFQGTLILTGTVEGCGTGTVVGQLQGRGQAAPPVTDATAAIADQSATTVGVTGRGSVHQDGAALEYTFQYSCH